MYVDSTFICISRVFTRVIMYATNNFMTSSHFSKIGASCCTVFATLNIFAKKPLALDYPRVTKSRSNGRAQRTYLSWLSTGLQSVKNVILEMPSDTGER
jgi:hypothetical protein